MLSGGAETLAPRARWSWIFACGVALVVLGLLALGNLVNATLVTTALLGLLLVVAGVVELFAAFAGRNSGGWRFLHAVLGVIYVFVGFNVFVDPLRGAVALTRSGCRSSAASLTCSSGCGSLLGSRTRAWRSASSLV